MGIIFEFILEALGLFFFDVLGAMLTSKRRWLRWGCLLLLAGAIVLVVGLLVVMVRITG